jgi:acyl-CoA thioester hydrolase
MKFQTQQYVRWGDLDAFGHVNNATYLVYAQEARYAWSKMIEMVVARAEVDFIAPIYTGDIYIDIEIWVHSIGNSSFGVTYVMKNGDELLARVKTVQVTVSLETKKSRPITDTEREFLTKYLETEQS